MKVVKKFAGPPQQKVSGKTEQSEQKPKPKHSARGTEKVHMRTQQELNTEKTEEQYIFNSGPETRAHARKTGSRASKQALVLFFF